MNKKKSFMSNLFGQFQRRVINVQWEIVNSFKLRKPKKKKIVEDWKMKITLVEVLKNDMLIKKEIKSMNLDRIEW